MDNDNQTPTPQVTVAPAMAPRPVGGKGSKAALILTVVLLLAALGAAGWFFMQNKSLKDDNNALKQQVTELSMEHEDAPAEEDEDMAQDANQAAADVLVTGQVVQESAGVQAVVDCMEQPGSLTEIWVRYGTDAANLKDTAKETNELGLGDAGTLAAYSVVIPAGELTNGQAYYYQCAGTHEGKTVMAGLAAFNAKK